LDYYRLPEDDVEKEQNIALQKEVFIAQINLAKKYNKPLIIHIRDASDDSKKILIENDAKKVGGVLHCFNADEQLLILAHHGFYFGIGGVLTFKNGKKLKNVLSKIPKDRLVIETDAPYLTPEPHRGKRNEPSYTTYVADTMAELLEISRQEIEEITTRNANNLFFD
jgi:TatD DNase family protein